MIDTNKLFELFKVAKEIVADVEANGNTIHHQRALIDATQNIYRELSQLKKGIKEYDLGITKQKDATEKQLLATGENKTNAERQARVAFREESGQTDIMEAEMDGLREEANMFKYYVRIGEIELQKFDTVGSSLSD